MSFLSVSRPGATLAAVALVGGLFWMTGCSRPTGSVTGKVTYSGKVLKGGGVTFVSTDGGKSYSSGINEDGSYAIPDLAGGEYKVCVETASLKPHGPPGMPAGSSGPPPGMMKGAPPVPKGKGGPPADAVVPEGYTASSPAAAAAANNAKKYMAIPDKYSDQKTTDLSYTSKGGVQTFDIDLK